MPKAPITTMKLPRLRCLLILLFPGIPTSLVAGLEPGEQINLTIRGVDPAEQQKVTGIYRIGESGGVRLPLLDDLLPARGLTPEQFARAVESAYKSAGIYDRPAIEVETLQGKDQQGAALVSVGGQVRRAGDTPFRKGMSVIQAIDNAGGRNDFGSRNLMLLREGKQYCLDFTNLKHKNIVLRPGDSIQVEQKGVLDRWKGREETVRKLME
jgi:protein involved in polysaccharide export with SLBB domain